MGPLRSGMLRGGVSLRALAPRDTDDGELPTYCDVSTPGTCTNFVAETNLPTTNGLFRVRAYRHWVGQQAPTEPLAIIYGDVASKSEVAVRVHDACFTSEVLGSMKCDCAEQLNYALDYIKQHDGIVVYLQQEGRGIGLANKIAAYHLQESGLDTVDANRALNLPDDSREYTAVANMLRDMDVKSIKLMTNNPRKIQLLEKLDVQIVDRIPVVMDSNEYSVGYLKAKGARMDHYGMENMGKPNDGPLQEEALYVQPVDASDPLEKFCADAPDADECRVYED